MNEEELQRQALHDFQKSSIETFKYVKKQRFIKFLIIILILIFCLFLLSTLLGKGLFSQYIRYYEISLNDLELQTIENIDSTKIPIFHSIPNAEHAHFYPTDLETYQNTTIANTKPYTFKINSYSCYIPTKKHRIRVSCNSPKDAMYLNNDTKYKMIITKYAYNPEYSYTLKGQYLSITNKDGEYIRNENSHQIYNGQLLNDLTNLVDSPAAYVIELKFSYKFSKGTIYVGFVNDGQNFKPL